MLVASSDSVWPHLLFMATAVDVKKQFLIPRGVEHGFLVLRVIAWKMA